MKGNKLFKFSSVIISVCAKISIIIGLFLFPSITNVSTTIDSFLENNLNLESVLSIGNSDNKLLKNVFFSKDKFQKEIIIYNGVTIEEGIKSNEEINNKAVRLTKNAVSDREKAKILYTWIGSNIEYDEEKAKMVLDVSENKDLPQSGAISAFENKSGICFDKACLYVAMARAVNLQVRLIGGQAFDGEQYVSHAWNQVYLNDENQWINVDSTFYNGGNYFDSNLFDKHNLEEIAGEW